MIFGNGTNWLQALGASDSFKVKGAFSTMLDEKDREKIALKKFSLVAPVINGQAENQKEYFKKLASEPIEMPHYGSRRYAVKTLQWWLYLYNRHGLEGLKPGYRSDRGKSRRVTEEIALKIQEKKALNPQLTNILLYEELVKDGVFTPDKLSTATFYRFLAQNRNLVDNQDVSREEKEIKRFSHQKVNQLWQTDILYGPYLRLGRASTMARSLIIEALGEQRRDTGVHDAVGRALRETLRPYDHRSAQFWPRHRSHLPEGRNRLTRRHRPLARGAMAGVASLWWTDGVGQGVPGHVRLRRARAGRSVLVRGLGLRRPSATGGVRYLGRSRPHPAA